MLSLFSGRCPECLRHAGAVLSVMWTAKELLVSSLTVSEPGLVPPLLYGANHVSFLKPRSPTLDEVIRLTLWQHPRHIFNKLDTTRCILIQVGQPLRLITYSSRVNHRTLESGGKSHFSNLSKKLWPQKSL